MKLNRLSVPVISIVTGALALVLSIIVVVGNAKSNALQKYATIENIIKIKAVSSKSRRDLSPALPTIFPSLSQPNNRDVIFIPVDNPISRASSFSDSRKPSILPQPSGTDSKTSRLDGLASQALIHITKIYGESFNEALNSLISEIMNHLGIRDWYGLYFGVVCSADYSPGFRDPDASLSNIRCHSLRGLSKPFITFFQDHRLTYHEIVSSKGLKIQDTFQLGTTILDVTALNIPAKLIGGNGCLTAFLRLLYYLGVAGAVFSGALILVSPILFLSRFCKPIVHFGIGAISSLALILILFIALIQTVIWALLGGMINQLTNDYGIYAKPGLALLILAWLSVILLSIPTLILLTLWFNGIFTRRSNVGLEKKRIPIIRTSTATSVHGTNTQSAPGHMRQSSHNPET